MSSPDPSSLVVSVSVFVYVFAFGNARLLQGVEPYNIGIEQDTDIGKQRTQEKDAKELGRLNAGIEGNNLVFPSAETILETTEIKKKRKLVESKKGKSEESSSMAPTEDDDMGAAKKKKKT